MLDTPSPRTLILDVDDTGVASDAALRALASEPRRRILALLAERLMNVSEIARELGLPVSTANLHVGVLEDAGLLLSEHRPAKRGLQKVCTRAYDAIVVRMPSPDPGLAGDVAEVSMPIGAYVDADVRPSCGLASADSIIGMFDDPSAFFEPARVHASLLWFHQGRVTYRFPNRLPPRSVPLSVEVSCEVCSEAPLHHDDWPSDITLSINDLDIATWTSPSDFGGQRGSLTPAWWDEHNTQYGMLKVFKVDGAGGWVDGVRASDMTLDHLDLAQARHLDVTLSVREDAEHVGGLNLFGRAFGNYPQDIVLRIRYRSERREG